MKKILFIIIIINLVLPATLTYGAPRGNPRIKSTVSDNVQTSKVKQEIEELQTQISSNGAKLVKLKKDAKNSYNKAINRLQQLLKKKNSMTQKQLDLLTEAAMTLKIDSKALDDNSQTLNKINLKLQKIKKGTNYELIKDYMNEIIDLQNISINNLQQALIDMNRIAKM